MYMYELCKNCNVTKDTVRYYHKIDLLERPLINSKNGYGLYDDTHIERIRFIKKLQSFGFSLKEIKRAIYLEMNNELTEQERLQTLQAKLKEINKKLNKLNEYKESKAIYHLSKDKKL